MSIIFLTGMLIYEGYRLLVWGNLAPTGMLLTLPSSTSPIPNLNEIHITTKYIAAAMTTPSPTTFHTDKHFNKNGITVAPDMDYYQTSKPDELSSVQLVTDTNNVSLSQSTQVMDRKNTSTTTPENYSIQKSDLLPKRPEINSVSDKSDASRNSSKISNLLLLLRLYPNTTNKIDIYIKKKHKKQNRKPTTLDVLLNALNSKPQFIMSDLTHVFQNKGPTYGKISESSNSTFINTETTTVTEQLKQTTQFASIDGYDLSIPYLDPDNFTIMQNTPYERKVEKKLYTPINLEKTPNIAKEDTLLFMQILNNSNTFIRDPRKTGKGLTQDNLIPYTQFRVHEVKARIINDKTASKSIENPYRLFTTLAYNKYTKPSPETKTTQTLVPSKEVTRNCRSNKQNILSKLLRKMRHTRIYYTKSYQETEQKSIKLHFAKTIIKTSTPADIDKKLNEPSSSFQTTPEIDDDEDETELIDENEAFTQFKVESTTSSLKTLNIKLKLNATVENEEDESESDEETDETPMKNYKKKTETYIKRIPIQIKKNKSELNTTNIDEEDETESDEVTEVSPTTQDHSKKGIHYKNDRKILPKTQTILKSHLTADEDTDDIRYENSHRKTRTSKPSYKKKSAIIDVTETNDIEDETDSDEIPSVNTTLGENPEQKLAEAMDILFILKTRLEKPTAATLSFESKDLLQILVPNTSSLNEDTNFLNNYNED